MLLHSEHLKSFDKIRQSIPADAKPARRKCSFAIGSFRGSPSKPVDYRKRKALYRNSSRMGVKVSTSRAFGVRSWML